jgi:hypothetical protein
MSVILALPLLSFLVILQTAVISRMPLLHGTADIVMVVITAWALQERVRTAWLWSAFGGLLVGFVSALHFSIPLSVYLLVTGLALALRQRVWQIPILAMLAVTLIGTLAQHILTYGFLVISGTSLPLEETFNQILLPSLMLNLILAVPVFALVRDLADWVYPEEIEI